MEFYNQGSIPLMTIYPAPLTNQQVAHQVSV